jgi:sugar (pentulose or hexulose) kinase
MNLLTIDLGSSATKAALWSEHGLIALGRASVAIEHPKPGWA